MYAADGKRYDKMKYNRCGKSGLKLKYPLDFGIILEIPLSMKI